MEPVRPHPYSPPQKVIAANSNLTRKPSPLRKSIRVTEYGTFQEEYADTSESDDEMEKERAFNLEYKYKELRQNINGHVMSNIKVSSKYQHRDHLLSWIPSAILVIPLVAGILTTLSTVYKKEALILAAGIATVTSTSIVAVVNAAKANLNYSKTGLWYHDRASKLKEVQDQLSFAINVRQFQIDEFQEHQSRVDLLMNLPLGSDITGTQNIGHLEDLNQSRRASVVSQLNHTPIPKNLERQINRVINTKTEKQEEPSGRSRSQSHSRTYSSSPSLPVRSNTPLGSRSVL